MSQYETQVNAGRQNVRVVTTTPLTPGTGLKEKLKSVLLNLPTVFSGATLESYLLRVT